MMPETLPDIELVQLGLLNSHTHFLVGEINYENVSRAVQWIIYENKQTEPIEEKGQPKSLILYINSSGGDLYNAFALIDMMDVSKYPVYTVGIGNIMSAGALIFACGAKGHRYLAKHTGIMMHQFSSDMDGKEHELQAAMLELKFCRSRINDLLINHCQISEKFIREKLLQQSDAWLTAEDAVKYKLADRILSKIL